MSYTIETIPIESVGKTPFKWSGTATIDHKDNGYKVSGIEFWVENPDGYTFWSGGGYYVGYLLNSQPTPVPDEVYVHAGDTVSMGANFPAWNDIDSEVRDGLTVTGVGGTSLGTLSSSEDGMTYAAPAVITGTQEDDSFTYTVADGYGGSSSDGLVTIHVVNAVPEAYPSTFAVMSGSEGDGTLYATDPDWQDALTLVSVGGAAHGVVTALPPSPSPPS